MLCESPRCATFLLQSIELLQNASSFKSAPSEATSIVETRISLLTSITLLPVPFPIPDTLFALSQGALVHFSEDKLPNGTSEYYTHLLYAVYFLMAMPLNSHDTMDRACKLRRELDQRLSRGRHIHPRPGSRGRRCGMSRLRRLITAINLTNSATAPLLSEVDLMLHQPRILGPGQL